MKVNISFDIEVNDTTRNEAELVQFIQKASQWLHGYAVLLLEKKMEYQGRGMKPDDPLIKDIDEKAGWVMQIPNNLKIENHEFAFTHREPGYVETCIIKNGANISET